MRWTHNLIFRTEAEGAAFERWLVTKKATMLYTRRASVLLVSDEWYGAARKYADQFEADLQEWRRAKQ